MAHHEFAWNPVPFEFKLCDGKINKYAGAVQCGRCGIRIPCYTAEIGEVQLAHMDRVYQDDDSECDFLLLESIYYS